MKTLTLFLLLVSSAFSAVITTITITNSGPRAQQMGYRIHLVGKVGTAVEGQTAEGDYLNIIQPGANRVYILRDEDVNSDYDIVAVSQILMTASAELVGNSYVIVEGGTETLSLGNTFEAPIQATYTWSIGGENDVNGRSATPDAYKSLWITRDTSLTSSLFREGIDKLVVNASATGDSQKQVADQQKELLSGPTAATTMAGQIWTQSGAQALGDAAASAAKTAVEVKALPDFGDSAAPSAPGMLTLDLQGDYGGVTSIDLDPANNIRMSQLASFIKKVIAWAIFVAFQIFVWNYFKEVYITLAGAQQAKGNAVAGGTGGWATALLSATLITAVLLSVPVAFWALADSGMTWGESIVQNPLEASADGVDFIQVAGYLFGFFVPVGTLLSALASYFLVLRGGLAMMAFSMALIRFIVP